MTMASRWGRWIAETFHQWVGYRVTEKEILEWMKANGYVTSAAKLTHVQLYALQRPGWVQVFRFQVEASMAGHPARQLFGALRSDERYGSPQICVFDTQADRDHRLQQWSTGLIVRR